MSIVVNVNGESINYPQTGDTNWGDEATDFAIQTSSAFAKVGLSTGTTVDIPGTLDVTGATTLDSTLTVAGTTTLNGNTTLTGNLLNSNGSSSLPSISFSSDNDNGFYYIGSNNFGISIGGSKVGEFNSNGLMIIVPYWNIIDQKANATEGGTFTNGAWRTRDLNTTRGANSISGSSLSLNQFTLPSGTYRIFATAPAYYTGNHKAKLYNITDSSDTLLGTNERSAFSSVTDGSSTRSIIFGIFTIASSKVFEIQHRCQNSQTTTGFGTASSFGVNEIYTIVELWKLA